MKLLLLALTCSLMVQQTYALDSWVIGLFEYNDIAQAFLWQWIVYGIQVLGPGAAVCNWVIPLLYSFLGSFITPTLSGTAQFDACMKGIYQYREYFYYGGLQENQKIDFTA